MKALSIRQPWAWLIVHGWKDIENRGWKTGHRGEFFVHAGKTFDDAGLLYVAREHPEIQVPHRTSFGRGGIVGRASLVDCVRQHDSPWFFGPYGFVLEDPRPTEFRPLRGQLGFFEVEGVAP